MSNIVLYEGKALKSKMTQFAKRVKSWTEYVASIGCSVVYHAAKHGDTGYLNDFFKHLPAAYTRPFMEWLRENGVSEWLAAADGVFSIKKTEEAKAKRGAFADAFSPEDWTDFKVKRTVDFTLETVEKRLSGLLKEIGKHEEVEVPEAVIENIAAARATVARMLEAGKTAQAA